jgi:epoxyqueuosine reductase
MFFLGELFINRDLPATPAATDHCGTCNACMTVCPTQAIVAPQRVDARRCISYLTIEHAGPIPHDLRPLIGNHVYGCDDCQLVCPWNKFAQKASLPDFDERPGFVGQSLVRLLGWREAEFLRYTEGGPIRRIGHERWLRNVAVAAGNAIAQGSPERDALRAALSEHVESKSELVREHVRWAISQD